MSTRDRIEEWVKTVLAQMVTAADDEDVTQQARGDIRRLYFAISWELGKFNQPDDPDPLSDGGPTQADVKGEVTHDIG